MRLSKEEGDVSVSTSDRPARSEKERGMARRRLFAGVVTALCLSGLRGREGGLGASAVRWNGRSPNRRDSASEWWTKSDHAVSRRHGGSEYDSPYYSTSAFSSNFSGPHHHVREPSPPLHAYSSRSQHSRWRHPQDHARRQTTSVAVRQNRGIEDQGEPVSKRASLMKPSSLFCKSPKGVRINSMRAIATFRDEIASQANIKRVRRTERCHSLGSVFAPN